MRKYFQENNLINNRYLIIEEVGSGGMGVVFKAYDKTLHKEVALKVLKNEDATPKQRARFLREVESISKLHHQNIIQIHEVHTHPQLFFSMDYIEGQCFKEYIQNHSLHESLHLFNKISQAVHYTHENQIVHRDIKPSNIMVTSNGEPILMDFGLAKIMYSTDKITTTGNMMGSVSYASPEQLFGKKIDYRADIYSLGVMLYEIIFGKLPFVGETHENLLFSILNSELDFSQKKVSVELRNVCKKALARETEQRYQSVKSFIVDLRNVGKHKRRHSTNTTHSSKTLMGLAVIIIAIIGMFFIPRNTSDLRKQDSKQHIIKAQQHFEKHRLLLSEGKVIRAWRNIKRAMELSPNEIYYVYAWRTFKTIYNRYKYHDLSEDRFRDKLRYYQAAIEAGQTAHHFFVRAFLTIGKDNDKAIVMLKDCYKKFQLPEAAVHIISFYKIQNRAAEAQAFFSSIKNKNAHILLAYGDITGKHEEAARKGNIVAKFNAVKFSSRKKKFQVYKELAKDGYLRALKGLEALDHVNHKHWAQQRLKRIEVLKSCDFWSLKVKR